MPAILTGIILAQLTVPTFAICKFETDGSDHPYYVDIDCGSDLGKGRAILTESEKYFYGEIIKTSSDGSQSKKLLLIVPRYRNFTPHSYDTQCWDQGKQVLCSDPESLRETYWGWNKTK